MKRFLAIILAGFMLISLAACGEKEDEATWKLGAVQTEGNFEHYFEHALGDHGNGDAGFDFVMYDNLNSALMSLNRKDINALSVDKVTGDYIAAHNSDYISIEETHYSNIQNYSMMTMESKTEVYNLLNNAIKDMKADGTLDNLIENELKAYIESDPEAKDLPHFDGAQTIKIGVTGDVPPMDYVAANGKAAGFNIALLTEIANRAKVNFELVQIDSSARATALSTGKVDAVFWTKGFVCSNCDKSLAEEIDGTVITESYFSSPAALVMLKSDK
jgi:ABC-type amino acid transport substrate-binding protein